MNWIDTHAHPYMCDRPIAELVDAAQDAGVSRMIAVATTLENAAECVRLAKTFPGTIFPTIGIHPVEDEPSEWLARMDLELQTGQYVAVGEIGLDYHWRADTRDQQIRRLELQLQLAQRYALPVIIHNRKSEADMVSVLAQFPDVRKVIHCFALGVDWVARLDGPNTYYSFTGMITRWEPGDQLEALKAIPLSQIMLETDCPYLTPESFKGQENQPAFLVETARVMAQHKQITVDELAIQTTATAVRFFGLEK